MENYQNEGGQMLTPVNDHKALAIVSLVLSILCCNILAIIFAIIALVKSNEVRRYQLMGQQLLAEDSAKKAGTWGWVAIGVIIACTVIQFVWFFLMGGAEMYQQMLETMMQQ